jgi:hypothetical protein
MTVECDKCKYFFRDNYRLTRHLNRKFPCTQVKTNEEISKNEKSIEEKNIIINGNVTNNVTVNNYITINLFGNEDLSHINAERIIEEWRQINKTDSEEYTRAGKLVTTFHGLVNQNPNNHNIKLKNTKSMVTQVLSNDGWSKQSTHDIIDQTIKTRAGQLVTFKESIEECNKKVFKSEKNRKTWKHIESFKVNGREHHGPNDNTRRLRTNIRIALLN